MVLGRHGSASLCRVERKNKMAATISVQTLIFRLVMNFICPKTLKSAIWRCPILQYLSLPSFSCFWYEGHQISFPQVHSAVCCRYDARPSPQLMGQLPVERVTPGTVFEKVGVDYARPVLVKYGMIRKPTVVKAYLCLFVSLTVKAVHLEVVSNLTSEAFIATL